MKFYRGEFDHENFINSKYYYQIINNKLTAIYNDFGGVIFFKNGGVHNAKNAAYFGGEYKQFRLNAEYYGDNKSFTKESWRRFVKLQVFL